jgi:predicted DCC family thiol-disulfide oxidoreductase YuxK
VTWNEHLGTEDGKDKETIHLLTNGRHLIRSSAIVEIFRGLRGPWNVLGHVIWLIPRPIRNLGYRIVAENRQRVSKVTGSCSIPESSERSCLLP